MKKKEYLKVVLILPVNVLVTIPFVIFLLTSEYFSFKIININSIFFYLSIFLFLIGLTLAIWSVKAFYNEGGDGTPGPWNPVSNLVVTGPYQYIRNPMLLGVFFLLLSESIFFNSFPVLIWFCIFFIINIIYFKFFEEKELIKRFGMIMKNIKKMYLCLFQNLLYTKN